MADDVALDLVDKRLVTNQITLTVGYDVENLTNPEIRMRYNGRISVDYYGRQVPYHSHGTTNFPRHTSSSRMIIEHVTELFERIVNPELLVRRLTLSVNRLLPEDSVKTTDSAVQLDLFTDYEELERKRKAEEEAMARERRRQEAIIKLRKQFGKNTILKGLNYADGATQRERNKQIGGHKA